MPHSDRLSRVTWRCVHFASADEIGGHLRDALTAAGLRQFDLSGGRVRTNEELFRALAAAMAFPDYFGMNWNAVLDCLRDLKDRQPAQGYVLFVHEADWLWRRCYRQMGVLIEVWLSAAEEWGAAGVPFHLVFIAAARPTAVA
jgi:RNAse (barnase) inhibitor barstar